MDNSVLSLHLFQFHPSEDAMIRIGKNQEASLIMRLTEGFTFEPLVKGLIERGSVGMIVGPAKSKKSMLALNIAFSIVEGVPFLGHECPGGERVIYVNLELTKTALGVRLRSMNRFFKSRTLSRLAFLSAEEFTGNEPLVDVKNRKVSYEVFDKLIEAAKEWKATVVIVDPLYYVVGEENDNVLVTEVLKQFSRLRDETSCTVAVVHHTRKERTDWSDPFQAGRGASSIGGFFEWVLGIEPDDDGLAATLHHGSRNLRTAPDMRMRFVEDTLTWRSMDDQSPDEVLDRAMGDSLEMPYLDFVAVARAAGISSKERIDQLLESSKTLVRIKAHRGQKAVVRRMIDGVLPGFSSLP